MERGFKKFAGWVLSLNFVLLAGLVIVVALAAYQVYLSARRQALEQVRVRQELLATQAARGIEDFYRDVLDDLDVLSKSKDRQTLGASVWESWRGRVTRLVELDPVTGKVVYQFHDGVRADLPEVITADMPWLKALSRPSIGSIRRESSGYLSVVATKTAGSKPVAIVAVVPILTIETRFLNDLVHPGSMGAVLCDHETRVLSSDHRELLGVVLSDPTMDPRIREVTEQSLQLGQRSTREFLQRRFIRGVELDPAMMTIQPVNLADGTRWWLGVSSNLTQVDSAVGKFFKQAIIGGSLVIAAITAILVSTSTQVIRGRLKVERLQRELLSRELDQAREIQLSWLPEQQETVVPLDIAGVNRPASHVSGDFYNWFELEDRRVCVVIGDVTGHGLPAAFLMATTQLLVRAVITRLPDPGQCLTEMNRLLCQHVFSGQFVTLLVLVIDPATNKVELATAGHPPPLVGTGHGFEFLKVEPQLVLAIEPSASYKTQRFDLQPGSSILLYTDGVTDVQSPTGERAGDDWLAKAIVGSFKSSTDIIHAMMDAIDAYRSGREPADDLTLCAIQLQPQSADRESVQTTVSSTS